MEVPWSCLHSCDADPKLEGDLIHCSGDPGTTGVGRARPRPGRGRQSLFAISLRRARMTCAWKALPTRMRRCARPWPKRHLTQNRKAHAATVANYRHVCDRPDHPSLCAASAHYTCSPSIAGGEDMQQPGSSCNEQSPRPGGVLCTQHA